MRRRMLAAAEYEAVISRIRYELLLRVSVGCVYLPEHPVAKPVDDGGCNAARDDYQERHDNGEPDYHYQEYQARQSGRQPSYRYQQRVLYHRLPVCFVVDHHG